MKRPIILMTVLWLAAVPTAAQQPLPRDSGRERALETRVRERIAAVAQQRLRLSDEQLRRLQEVNASFEPRRRALAGEERDARVVLRAELARGERADDARVDEALKRLFRVQRQRLDLAEQEQAELARFMQPAQRAGYLALQDQLRRRIEQMRREPGPARRRSFPR